MGNMNDPVAFGRDHGVGPTLFKFVTKVVSVESLVGEQRVKLQALNEIWHTGNFTALAWQQFEPDQIAQRIRQRQNFGRQAAF